MAKQLKELVLFEGEKVLYQVEGNAWSSSSNPFEQLIAGFFKIFWVIFGVKLMTYIIATDKRIIQVDKKTILWGMMTGNVSVITLNKKNVQSVGYQHVVAWFFWKTSYFVLASMTSVVHITYKGNRDELGNIVAEFSRLVSE